MISMNNVVLKHNGHIISIAQHKHGGRIATQEIMAYGPHVDDEIIIFDTHARSLVAALEEAIAVIDAAVKSEGLNNETY